LARSWHRAMSLQTTEIIEVFPKPFGVLERLADHREQVLPGARARVVTKQWCTLAMGRERVRPLVKIPELLLESHGTLHSCHIMLVQAVSQVAALQTLWAASTPRE